MTCSNVQKICDRFLLLETVSIPGCGYFTANTGNADFIETMCEMSIAAKTSIIDILYGNTEYNFCGLGVVEDIAKHIIYNARSNKKKLSGIISEITKDLPDSTIKTDIIERIKLEWNEELKNRAVISVQKTRLKK